MTYNRIIAIVVTMMNHPAMNSTSAFRLIKVIYDGLRWQKGSHTRVDNYLVFE
jgi:hypothetical protein